MKKIIKIEEGFEIDWEESAKQNRHVFREVKPPYPMHIKDVVGCDFEVERTQVNAVATLLSLRNAWWRVDNWEPVWNFDYEKYCITKIDNQTVIHFTYNWNCFLCFKTRKTAQLFLETFNPLIEQAKEII